MRKRKTALLAACLLAGAAVMSGCTARPALRDTPKPDQQQTAQPTNGPTAQPQDGEEGKTLTLEAAGKVVKARALAEHGELLLPLMETGEALGWTAKAEQTEEEARTKRVMTLTKGESRITVSWTVSDNTVSGVSWQKDGLLIPVDTRITTVDESVYVPAAFFETAMDIAVTQTDTTVILSTPKPADTPKLDKDSTGEND